MRCSLRTAAHGGLSLAVVALLAGPWLSQAAAQQDQDGQRNRDQQNNAAEKQADNNSSQRQNAQDDGQAPPPPARSFSDRPNSDRPNSDRPSQGNQEQFDDGIRPADGFRGEQDGNYRGAYGQWNSGRVYRGYRGGYAYGGGYGGYAHSGYRGGYGSCGSHGGSYQNYQQNHQPQFQDEVPPSPQDDAAAGNRRWSGNAQGQFVQQQIDPQRKVIGIRVRNDDGTRVTMVRPGSPAEQAGLQEGDMIVSVNGDQVQGTDGLIDVIRRMDGGEDVELTVKRDGEEKQLTSQLTTYRDAFGDESSRGQGNIAQAHVPPAPPTRRPRNAAEESLRRFGEGERRTVARVPLDDQRTTDEMQREIDRLTQENEDLRRQLAEKSGDSLVDAPPPESPQPAAEEAVDELEVDPPAAPEDADESIDAANEADEVETADDDADEKQGDKEDEAEATDRPDAIRENNVDEPQDEADDDNENDDENADDE